MTRSGQILLVTGPIGAGKTTYCVQHIDALRRQGADIAGVLSPARFVNEVKTGIDVIELRSGERRALAHLRTGDDLMPPAGVFTPRWRFDSETLDWVNQALAQATPCDLLVVDELGPLELEQERGWVAGIAAVDSRAYERALVVVRSGLLVLAQARWPDAETVWIGVSPLGNG